MTPDTAVTPSRPSRKTIATTPSPAPFASPHPAWLPDAALDLVRTGTVAVLGTGRADTIRAELDGAPVAPPDRADLVVAVRDAVATAAELGLAGDLTQPPAHGYAVVREAGRTVVLGADDVAALHGFWAVVRERAVARLRGGDADARGGAADAVTTSAPLQPIRVLDHWDNVAVHPVMGQVERGYAGGSIFYAAGEVRADLSRVRAYARLLAATGVDDVCINNVNVHAREAQLLTDDLDGVARIAAELRAHGITTHLAVSFGAPVLLGDLDTADPLDPAVAAWWADAVARVYAAVPDFGGFVVKADSEGQPGPFAYGRTHADGANLLARALAPHGGTLVWRAFVYDHHQDWRDRRTDRARAAHDHFTPLDGEFEPNVVLQVKHGPLDFQVREPVSPVLAAMPRTRVALELQVTQEYTGQQRHVCWLGPWWEEILGFRLDGARTVAQIVAGQDGSNPAGGVAAVSNVGADEFWTGHPLAQANLYAFGRLAWDPTLAATDVLDEWIALTFAAADDAALRRLRDVLHRVMDDSWRRYEGYTAPLGVCFMVNPGDHYGPAVDGYEYSPWGTYHFADRDGIGVDRTRASGTGYTGQYPAPWRDVYESVETCPDELLLFFHHVPYGHVLHSGATVIQHVYDSRADAVEQLTEVEEAWSSLSDLVGGALPAAFDARVRERLAEQRRSAVEWRDQVRSAFFRRSGVPDASGRTIY
ncbi:alpha-glucuronidase [Litorihabitans aurantiacus]|uniref:Xylan alpha-(1->2)-glucuronosidase n=1 Tax=Litorihabitans aurantiacus TaxID=1930061 RepID=A0AA38CWL4_9MICO|nr:alpha-glucuronidase [Litorihabitans aurantiacus]GMA33252.1 xylan alpha-(1->2)-glucuronosidase [Litorihabitans aurantiacus]